MRDKIGRVIGILLLLAAVGPGVAFAAAPPGSEGTAGDSFARFEEDLEEIRQTLVIPGMSAAVIRGGELVWARGFGYADLENKIEASPNTPYGLASVTKPVAAVLIMQLVEEGLIDLDAPVTRYGVQAGERGDVTVRHLLTHTSEGVPGTAHTYNGNRYALLGGVLEGATGQTFAALLSQRILLPLDMKDTALNPLDNWGGPTLSGVQDFVRLLGWGQTWENYPDVYARLARPYQLDAQYQVFPGMYHLVHSPAAGLVSSVTDLAKFDIALSTGRLLDDAARSEMFSPAYSTYRDRPDLRYGLGWYVQNLEGLRLQWHSGRWPPSTSALYLRVPEHGLTFIVLANTDNLTVPFHGIGNGDISGSALALTFLRHFVYPELYGTSLPVIDWQADRVQLVQALSKVEDEVARRFLERELWSTRQAYASVGRTDEADKLGRVNVSAYPFSYLRADENFTHTAGPSLAIPPAIHASAYVRLTRIIGVWFALVLVSLGWLILRLARGLGGPRYEWPRWLIATLILGPLALLIQDLTDPRRHPAPLATWRQALRASLFAISGYAIAWALAVALLINLGRDEPHPLMILGVTYLTPLLIGLIVFRVPSLLRQSDSRFGKALSQGLLTEIITLNLGFAVLLPLTLVADQWLTTIPYPTSPYFWSMLAGIALIGVAVLFPLHYWMARRGFPAWPAAGAGQSKSLALPTLRQSQLALVTTLVIMIAAIAVTVSQTA